MSGRVLTAVIFLVCLAGSPAFCQWAQPDPCGGAKVKDLLSEAQELIEENMCRKAIVLLSDVLEKEPECLLAKYLRGKCYYKLAEYGRAGRDMWDIVDASRTPDQAFLYLGLINLKKGLYDRAFRFFEDANSISEKPLYAGNAAIALARAGRWTEAWEACRAVRQMDDCPERIVKACGTIMRKAEARFVKWRRAKASKRLPIYGTAPRKRSASASGKTAGVHVRGHWRRTKSGKRTWAKSHRRS